MADEKDIILSPEELEALIDKIVDKHEKRNKPKAPPPWDTTTERRTAERRKPKEPDKPKYGKIGGLISFKE